MQNIDTRILMAEIDKELSCSEFFLKNPVYPGGKPMSDTELSILFGYSLAFVYLKSFLENVLKV